MFMMNTILTMNALLILLLALGLDAILGDAPNRFHPVAWLGKFISFQIKYGPRAGNIRQFLYGASMVLFTIIIISLPLLLLIHYVHTLNDITYIILSVLLLKNTFSLRGLWKAVEEMKTCLRSSTLNEARLKVRSLVERNTDSLSEGQLISATVESCAENLCDSFIAPLLYYAIFGLAGAIIYRIVNTFDAMIGYHGKWEYTGKFSARFDDILNFIPARLSAVLIIFAAWLCRTNPSAGWNVMITQHMKTESPNAGWSIGAMAGSLEVILEKNGCYMLGNGESKLSLDTIGKSQTILLVSASLWIILIIVKEVIIVIAS